MLPVFTRLAFPAHGSHRGGRGSYAPENTMYAYRKAVHECSTAILEVDLHLTKDGNIVLCHDESIDSISNGHGRIENMSLEQLRTYDAAYKYTQDGDTYPLRGQSITIPTLQEVLDEFLQVEKLAFFFDVKSLNVIEPMLKVIKERKIEDRVILGALDYDTNKAILAQKPTNVPLTIDAQSMTGVYTAYLQGKLAAHPIPHEIVGFLADEARRQTLIPNLFDVLHKKGKKIAVFGELLNHKEGQKQLIDMKADILFTDQPDILKETLSS
eukprot:Phypoly_transcript_15728.p1 GENE.Phypoly_transcript_15728~~Phypoly_transcript_15728.p1  ORF type:complete len:269 (+),score=34.34 Phypoly_transcript_15728:84-890(+)